MGQTWQDIDTQMHAQVICCAFLTFLFSYITKHVVVLVDTKNTPLKEQGYTKKL